MLQKYANFSKPSEVLQFFWYLPRPYGYVYHFFLINSFCNRLLCNNRTTKSRSCRQISFLLRMRCKRWLSEVNIVFLFGVAYSVSFPNILQQENEYFFSVFPPSAKSGSFCLTLFETAAWPLWAWEGTPHFWWRTIYWCICALIAFVMYLREEKLLESSRWANTKKWFPRLPY